MSFGQKLLFPAATPEATARYIVTKMNTNYRIGFYPRFWWPIVTLLKNLPWKIYKGMKF